MTARGSQQAGGSSSDGKPRRDQQASPGKLDGPVSPPARERPPVPPRPDGDGGSPASPSGLPKMPRWLPWAIAFGVLLVWNVVLFFPGGSPSSVAIPYS